LLNKLKEKKDEVEKIRKIIRQPAYYLGFFTKGKEMQQDSFSFGKGIKVGDE